MKIIGLGKDQYYDDLEGMINGRILPWLQDSDSANYPIWSNYGASQRDIFFLDYNGMIDTSFSITPYNSSNSEDVEYLKDIILGLRTDQALELDNTIITKTYYLHQNFPNPFNPSTRIGWEMLKNEFVNITVYDISGKVVKILVNSVQSSGINSIIWNGTNHKNIQVPSGLYFYTIVSDSYFSTKKMILLQ